MFSLVRIAIRSADSIAYGAQDPARDLARLASVPPYSSLRWLIFGLRNALAR